MQLTAEDIRTIRQALTTAEAMARNVAEDCWYSQARRATENAPDASAAYYDRDARRYAELYQRTTDW